jgi:hypothetical protein
VVLAVLRKLVRDLVRVMSFPHSGRQVGLLP